MFIKEFFFIIVLLFTFQTQSSECLEWFLRSGLASKLDNCQLKCSITPVDMKTFSCSTQCEDLCSKTIAEQILVYVPRLTEGDKVVISKMPLEAFKVFVAKEKVDKLTIKIFKKANRKDESDAFRHFVWSALLANELGVKKARIFLNAHEEDSTQSNQEKKMDIQNNSEGLSFFIKSKKSGRSLELDDIEKEALSRLRQKKLNVIKPRFKKIPGGYYSK